MRQGIETKHLSLTKRDLTQSPAEAAVTKKAQEEWVNTAIPPHPQFRILRFHYPRMVRKRWSLL